MAEKRMVSKSISVSEKVNELPDMFDMLLFTWMIPHTDDFGRLTGSPAKVKSLIVPMLDKSKRDVEASLGNLHQARLIDWYEIDGDRFIQVLNFEKHQQGLHKRTKSKYPEPPNYSRKFPEIPLEENRIEEKGREQKGTETGKSLIHTTIKELNLICKGVWELEQVISYVGMMEIDLILEALRRSEHIKKVAYALGILKDWAANGFTKLDDVMHPNVTPFTKGGQAGEGNKRTFRPGESKGQGGSAQGPLTAAALARIERERDELAQYTDEDMPI